MLFNSQSESVLSTKKIKFNHNGAMTVGTWPKYRLFQIDLKEQIFNKEISKLANSASVLLKDFLKQKSFCGRSMPFCANPRLLAFVNVYHFQYKCNQTNKRES